MTHRVTITGVGLVYSSGDSPAELFSALCEGRSALREIQAIGGKIGHCHLAAQLDDFEPSGYLSGRPLRPLDRVSQLACAASGLALKDSGWNFEENPDVELDLVVGTMFAGMHTIGEFDRSALRSGPETVSPMTFANTVLSAAAGQVAIWHRLKGTNTTIATGSISGISALGHGADLIRQGAAIAVLAGGVDEFSLEAYWGFDGSRSLCTNGATPELPVPFDARRNGFALGEGAGFVLLEQMRHAEGRRAEILAEVKGFATCFDPSQGVNPESAIRTAERSIRNALSRSGLEPTAIDFVSASANGSISLDSYELAALESVFKTSADTLAVTAIKSVMGESLAASGPAQSAAAIETFRTGIVPGIAGLEVLPSGYLLKGLSSSSRRINARTALINGVGLSGHSCSLVISAVN